MLSDKLKMLPVLVAPRTVKGIDTPEALEAFRKGWCHAITESHKIAHRRGLTLDLPAKPLCDIEETRVFRLAYRGRSG